MNALGRLVFTRFWTTLALLAAAGEWTLWCWWRGEVPPWPAHVVGLAALFALNRAACEAFEVEAHAAPHRHALGRTLLAAGFTAAIGAGALAVTAAAWVGIQLLGAFPAEAGAVGGGAHIWFGGAFDIVAGVVVSAAMGTALHGYVHGHRRLVVTRIEVPVAGLAPALDGLRIAHVSDLHVGPLAHAPSLVAALDAVTAMEPDVACVTGDIVDSRFADLAHWMPKLDRLRARHGVFAILGNHDWRAGTGPIVSAIRRHTGWRLLRDQVAAVDARGGRLYVAGLEDRPLPQAREALAALLDRLPVDAPSVLLVHHPSLFEMASGAAPLVLAGHTHGGQVAVPGLPRLNPARITMTRFDAGTYERDGSVLHVSRGLGASGQRLRIGVPREITVITLRAAVAGAAA